jgi:hypothetical protein
MSLESPFLLFSYEVANEDDSASSTAADRRSIIFVAGVLDAVVAGGMLLDTCISRRRGRY